MTETERRLAEVEARAREAGRSAKDPRSASICMVTVPELITTLRAAEAREARLREALTDIAHLVSKEAVRDYTLNGIIKSIRDRIATLEQKP